MNEQQDLFDYRLTGLEGRVVNLETDVKDIRKEMSAIRIDMSTINTNYVHISKSLQSLSTAGWGLLVVCITTLIGFFIWYIQKL
mgnify:CR=1 FL=1